MFNYKVFVAELIGTFALVFVGSAIALYDAGLLAVALAHGLTLAVFVYAFGRISGAHLNPAVTFGLALNGSVKWADAVVYWIAQFAGAVLAAFALSTVVGVVNAQAFAGAQTAGVLTKDFPYHALAVEALLTFFLVNAVLHTAVEDNVAPFAGWTIGAAYAIAILAGGLLTGGSFNPARTFGPAAVSGAARDGMMYLIYFVGPLLGAAIAVGVYKLLNMPDALDDEDLEPIPDLEEVPAEEEMEDVVEVEPVAPKRSDRSSTSRSTKTEE